MYLYYMKKVLLEEELFRIKQVMGIIKEDSFGSNDDIMKSLKKQVLGIKGTEGKEIVIDLIDKRTDDETKKTVTMKYDNDGNLITTNVSDSEIEMSEDLKNDLKVFLACTILATGAVSCQKDDTGFGYNFGAKTTTYYTDKGTPNKKVTISSPWGETEVEVDSTIFKKPFYTMGQGSKFNRPMTPTEAEIMKAGVSLQTERGMNNKKGTPGNEVYNYDHKDATVSGGPQYYEDNVVAFESCREHPLWKLGLRYFEIEGVDTQSMIQKADEEVRNQEWIK